jgi:hypothetical protein
MTDETTLDDATWQYDVDSVQRGGTTAATKARRHGEVSRPDATDGEEPHDQHEESGEDGSDSFGIPVQFKN